MSKINIIALRLILVALFFTAPCMAYSFPIPERLEFEISYAGVPAGRAVQEVTQKGGQITIVSTASSAAWLKLLFPVDDRIESVLLTGNTPSNIGTPIFYSERIKEGRTRFSKDIYFDRHKHEVTTKDLLNNTETVQKISPETYDTLSSFFYFRTVPLLIGSSTYIDIFDGKKIWNTEVQVLRREELKTPLGRFKTILIKPLLKSAGIFSRTGEMLIWLTDDDRRVPVLMKSKIKIGSISATLTGGSYWPGN